MCVRRVSPRTNYVLVLFFEKNDKKIKLRLNFSHSQKFPIFSAFKVLKKAWNFKTWGFFLQNSFSEKQYIIIFSTPVLYMYVVCKGKTLVYNRNITSFFTLKNFVILSLRRNSYLSNRNGFFWNILWEVLIKIYRMQPLKSTGSIRNKSNSIWRRFNEFKHMFFKRYLRTILTPIGRRKIN